MQVIVTSHNKELQKWVEMVSMGVFELNKNVFIIRCADGKTYAKVKFLDHTNKEDQKHYPKFEYEYPYVKK